LGKLCLQNGVRILQCPRCPAKEYLYTQCINMLFIAERLHACQEKNWPERAISTSCLSVCAAHQLGITNGVRRVSSSEILRLFAGSGTKSRRV
jgi:hypothetical protein